MLSRIAWTVAPVARRSVLSRGCILRSYRANSARSIGDADRSWDHRQVASFSAAAAQPKSTLISPNQQQQQLSEPDQDIIKDAVQRITASFSSKANSNSTSSSPENKMTDEELKKRMDAFHDLWVEARLCMDDCVDSAETEHFEEEAASAKHAVEEAMAAYSDLVYDLAREETKEEEPKNDAARKRSEDVRRTNGLKIEQLKAELASLLSTTAR
mmetsp:Transcript_4276/g.7663  ORF Transcript_4276/g.7663 Transcript_4276/m.7663 type:complete len:214 (-) Transcript_4276:71-712(-)